MISKAILRVLLVSMAVATMAPAQQFPFQLQIVTGDRVSAIQNRSSLGFASLVGQPQTARVRATYAGAGQATVSQPSVEGSEAFSARLTPGSPTTLRTGESFSFDIQFLPSNAALATAQLSLGFAETPTPAPATPFTAIELSLQGSVSSIVLSYVLPADQNVVPVASGGTIVFAATPLTTTNQLALNITNRGSGPGAVTGISIQGNAFRLSGLPLFPVALLPGQNLQVQVIYQPRAVGADTGQITVTFDSDQPATINLQGSGSASSLTYQILETVPRVVPPGGVISFPDTNVGETTSVVIRVLNSGTASGTVSSITPAGPGFQVSNVPSLPLTLAPDASLTFTVTFAPTRPGTAEGSLFINSDTLNLRGVGLGSLLTSSYTSGGTTVTIGGNNTSVIFSPVTISRSAQIDFQVRNSGTLPASIANIGVSPVNGPFTLTGLPALPARVGPNENLRFTIVFTPTALGFANGTLQIDNVAVPLVGSGTQPPSLPSYTIAGPSGNVAAGSQSSVGLTLASPYPVAIAGTLTLGVSGELPPDPASQFATGGRTVPFVIPANSSNAVFGSQGTRVGLQIGTVAGAITLTPAFATQAGNVDLNPSPIVVLQSVVPPSPPTLSSINFSTPTANSLLIRVTGFSNTRSLRAWNVQFTTVPGVSMPTSRFTIDVQQLAAAWFRSAASQAFGGQFTLSIPFNFQGAVPTGQSVLNSIDSVAVTVNNELGESNSIQSKLQ